jgi:hypothetical protein
MLCGAWSGQKQWGSENGNLGKPQRELQERLIGRLLVCFELELKPWKGEGYLIGGPSGPTQHVRDLPGLWAAIERATGEKCDPLAPTLLKSLLCLEK